MAYFRDWFGRDADYGYTYYDPKRRSVNWDKGYTNYSDFIFGYGTKSIKTEQAAQLLSTMSRVMGVTTDKFSSSRRADSVFIPTNMLKDPSLLDAFIGASLQNMAAYTHQSDIEREHIHGLGRGRASLNKTVAKILNQERVGKHMSKETPGYLRFVQKYKDHAYSSRPVPKNDNEHLIELFDRIIRYPDKITEEELEKFKDPINEIKTVIQSTGGIPDDFSGMIKTSKKITTILEKYIEEIPPKDDKDSSDDGDEGDEPEDESSKKSKSRASKSDEIRDFASSLFDHVDGIDGDGETDASSSFTEFMECIKADEECSLKAITKVDYITIAPTTKSEKAYAEAVDNIDITAANVLGSLLRRKSRDYQFHLKSMRSGRLDTGKLAEAKQGVPTIYERIGEVKTNKLCVTILVDESGSMHDTKADAARQSAIFLNEALKNVPDVELFIYGHTADLGSDCDFRRYGFSKKPSGNGSTQLLIYKEPGVHNSHQLGHISGKYENRDGSAMIAAAKRVRGFTPSNGVFIVISDGSPHANDYHGDSARKHVRKMANSIEQMGFQVIQVTIGGYHSSDMFKTVIDMDDVDTFPREFVNFLKKKINTMIKEKVTL
jgi:hypothetical protein